MSLIKHSYKYRMYPNKTQEELLAKTFGCVRVIWNACVDSFNSYDKETNPNPKSPTKSDLVIQKPWLNEVSAATLQQKQRDFIEFSKQYFNKNRKEKIGKPNYKNKHDNQSFRLPFPKFKITDNKIRIEKIGWVKIVIDREIPDNARFISCTVSKNRAGQYFVSVLVETEQCYKQKTGKTVGVDLGIKTLATLSDGISVENPHFLCENQAKLKRMQRHLSRKKLGSNRRNKCRLKVSRLHCDIANKRSWYMHNLTTMLVNNYDVICIEDLNTSGMLQNHKLASSISDTSFSMFRNQLEYKCRWYGKELIVIDRFYPSSKTCSRCDWKLLRAIEEGEVEIDNEKYHLSGIEYVAKRYQDMFYAGRDIYYFKGIGGHGMTDLLRNAIDDLLDTISSREAYRSAEHKMYAQMNQLTEAGAMISLAIELLTSNIRHSYGEINFERYPRPVEVEGEDKH